MVSNAPHRESTVNIVSGKTAEVRAYQGIFDLKHILQCISFTELCVEFASSSPTSGFGLKLPMAMSKLIDSNKKYSNLKGFSTTCA